MTPEGRKAFMDRADTLRYRCGRLTTNDRACPGRLRHTPAVLGAEPVIITRCPICDTWRLEDER